MNDRPPIVRALPTDPSVRSSESLFLTETAEQGVATRRLLEVATVPVPDHLAPVLGNATMVIVRRRLMSVDGVPVRIANSYFPADSPQAQALLSAGFIEGGLQKLFAGHGRQFGRARETLVARLPHPEEAALLEMTRTDPVVEIIRSSFDLQDRPVHTLQTICAAGRHIFEITQIAGDRTF